MTQVLSEHRVYCIKWNELIAMGVILILRCLGTPAELAKAMYQD